MSTLIGEMVEILNRKPESAAVIGLTTKERRAYGNAILANLMEARRYHLSSRTAQMASTLMFEAKNIDAMISLARPPFGAIWMEWNLTDQMTAMGQAPAEDAPIRIGVLVTQPESAGPNHRVLITLIIKMDDGKGVVISPISLVFDPDKPLDKSVAWLSNHRKLIAACSTKFQRMIPPGWTGAEPSIADFVNIMDTIMVGGEADLTGRPVTAQQQTLIDHASWTFTPWFSDPYQRVLIHRSGGEREMVLAMSVIGERLVESAGLLRFVIGALVLLNSQKFITKTVVKPTDKKPAPEAYRPNKKSPVYEFVEFSVPHKVVIRDIIEDATEHEPGHKKAQHEVSAHWVTSHRAGDPNCDHNYEKRGENSWICLACGAKRWRRKDHLRGDPALGVIAKKERLVLV